MLIIGMLINNYLIVRIGPYTKVLPIEFVFYSSSELSIFNQEQKAC